MSGAEKFFWAEVFSRYSNRRSVALAYALCVLNAHELPPGAWAKIDHAVIRKFKIRRKQEWVSFEKKASAILAAAAAQRSEARPERSDTDDVDEG